MKWLYLTIDLFAHLISSPTNFDMSPRVCFLLIVGTAIPATLLSVDVLYYRFSIHVESGGWGRIYDRGPAEFDDYFVVLSSYIPILLGLMLPNTVLKNISFYILAILCLFTALVIDSAVIWLPLENDVDEVFLLSMAFRIFIFLIGAVAAIALLVRGFALRKL